MGRVWGKVGTCDHSGTYEPPVFFKLCSFSTVGVRKGGGTGICPHPWKLELRSENFYKT